MNESLLAYKVGGTAVEPSLAEKYTANADLTEWTFNLRKGVKFNDGSDLTAKDVVASWAAQWDAANPLHKGRTSVFTYFNALVRGLPERTAGPMRVTGRQGTGRQGTGRSGFSMVRLVCLL